MERYKRFAHVGLATKLQDDVLRLKYINLESQEEREWKYLGLVNKKVGPPGELDGKAKEDWNAEVEGAVKKCIRDILIPSLEKNIEVNKRTFERIINEKLTTDNENLIKAQVMKGFGRAQRKWKKRDICDEPRLPVSLVNYGELGQEEVGRLRRGEIVDEEKGSLRHYNKIGSKKDLFKIFAHSIYGSSRFVNFISRSISKYMDAYELTEQSRFVPHIGILNNGSERWISNWHVFKALLCNRDLCFSEYELVIISKLYDINIRIFICGLMNDFDCIWQTDRRSNRVINLFLSTANEWSLLQSQRTRSKNGIVGTKDLAEIGSIITDSSINTESIVGTKDLAEIGSIITDSSINTEKEVVRSEDEIDTWSSIMELGRNSDTTNESSIIINNQKLVVGGNRCVEDDWSLISTDSENIDELLEIQHKVSSQFKTDSLVLSGKVVNHIKKDVNNNIEDSVEQGREIAVLENSCFTDIDNSRELIEIEDKVSKQAWVDSDWLNLSLITISTNESSEEKVSRNMEVDRSSVIVEGKQEHNRLVERLEWNNSLEDRLFENRDVYKQDSGENNVSRCDRSSYNNDRSEQIGTLSNDRKGDSREKREDDILDESLEESISSMEEDIRWLFEEEGYDTANEAISIKESITGSDDSIVNKDRYVDLSNKIRRRKFWVKWKNKIRNAKRNSNRRQDKQLYKEGIQHKNLDAVFDYYSKGLDRAEIELLSKGSTFCVASSRVDEDRLKADIYAYSRRLRLHEEFREQDWSQVFSQVLREQRDSQGSNNSSPANCNNSQGNNSQGSSRTSINKGRKLPSTYDPDSQNRNLARYCSCIQEESVLAIKSKTKFKDNLTLEHRKALDSLKKKVEDKAIVITLADKGSGIVVVDYDTYIRKGTKYIEVEAKAYSETDKSHKQIVIDIVSQRNKIVKKLREHQVISVETATYCMKQLEEKVTGMKFYYKIHKDTNIETMPLRPLQSCIGSPTHHLSQVLTDLLQPYLSTEYIPTFIQDSNQLLYRLSKIDSLDSDSTLISSDVAALYPSIPHSEGLEAVKNFLHEWSIYNSTQIKYIMLALELVITQNYVMWDGKIYSQDSGVAMGTPVAVAYANIFMDWIDRKLRQEASYIIEHIRYIDDNLFIIPENKIEDLMQIANALLAPHIRFTYEKLDKSGESGLPFLDTQLFISSNLTIESRLYTKKTDRHTYLLPTSFHPSHITRNIPLAVFNRIRRICSKVEWFQADAMLAISWLEDRGYKITEIKKAVENSSKRDRWEMIEKIEKNRINKNIMVEKKTDGKYEIPVIITYCQNAKELKEVFKKRQVLLDASFNQTQVRPRVAFRRQRNLSDILIQKGLRKPIVGNQVEEKILELCNIKHKYRTPCPCKGAHDQQICRCCAHLKTKLDNVKVRLCKKVTCESKNVIYVLGCRICQKMYVGETQQQLKDRFLQHLNNINKLSQPLYIHFKQVHKAENIYISVLEAVRSSDHTFRKIREAWWINRLQTLEPRGFNIKLECSQVYQASSATINIERGRGSRRM